ncbi:isoprenyl transferase [Halalkalibacterium halodurans]|jgi:undecaprenyl diphosphate synthase|uniref:Isoprenyl transferase n=2 Tax=Halalkalibacterium halodurans TaxID=86665 RepID=ISPT_HALH5|nr:isoprenyl transferase [Halalkalibacterium halodurans]Q9KA67.1 RecName: Full=Isoprenyl transferase [Halalkalibacterium halodurans C-125]MDY7222971.1 isoprenyl transferase [Halalkalibacterium halodurans]MDY7242192.1 isoprenyl transferase [Halalkalibacterium halodurans]MED3646200.1 isoprenyl transferase [Halalkalibacterium halodurans]MED4080088.1 isoprenyl transferase [Halalkalibacterium halodurans]MED4086855.1 isoprenyl transferase [Halalkalibacterium halodurans]
MLEKFSKWKGNRSNHTTPSHSLDESAIPKHVAIIMDGNGRWAKKKGLPRIAGHREGMKVINKIVRKAIDLKIEVLSLYAFSTENWKRPRTEVDYLLKLPERFLKLELPNLMEENVQVRIMGGLDTLPEHTAKAVTKAMEETKDNTGLILNFALNYGSRYEMVEAMKQVAKEVETGTLSSDAITEDVISRHLMTADLRDPDLLIRTSGEIRLSNFMLWQLAYSEFWFTDVLWPDFTEHHLTEAIAVYQKRARRYGGV